MMYKLKDLENKLKHLHEDFKEISRFCTDTDGKKLVKYEPFLKEIIERGEFFDCRTRDDNYTLSMPFGRCHMNVAEVFSNGVDKEEDDIIYSGYALNSILEWFPHSWIANKDGNIVETFSALQVAYYGYALDKFEEMAFIEYWLDK